MTRNVFFSFIILLAFAAGCGGGEQGGELDLLKEAKKELLTQKGELNKEVKAIQHKIDSLDKEIAKLDPDANKVKAIAVEVDTMKLAPFQSYVEVYGTVESGSNVLIVPEINGLIKKIVVKDGQSVKKGQVLAYIDTDVLQKNLQELKTGLSLAEELYQKQENLRKQDIGSEVQYLEAKNRKESLEQSIQTVQTQISKGIIRAPIDGKIQNITPREGEMASPQMPFARIVNTKTGAYVETEISEAFYNRINVNDKVSVRFNSIDTTVEASITFKSNFIDPGNRTFKVHVSLPKSKEGFPPNLLGVVTLKIDSEKDVFSLPTHVIQMDEKIPYLFTVKRKKGDKLVAEKTTIKKGNTSGNNTIIASGLKEGDVVITQAVMSKLKGKSESVEVSIK